MKKKDVILIAAVLGLAALFWAGMRLFNTGGNQLKISLDGESYGFYSLDEDQTIKIGNGNVCRIEGGTVTMTEADCPDKLCMKQKAISREQSGSIICLPNRVVLEISGDSGEQSPDVIAMKIGGSYDFIYEGYRCGN